MFTFVTIVCFVFRVLICFSQLFGCRFPWDFLFCACFKAIGVVVLGKRSAILIRRPDTGCMLVRGLWRGFRDSECYLHAGIQPLSSLVSISHGGSNCGLCVRFFFCFWFASVWAYDHFRYLIADVLRVALVCTFPFLFVVLFHCGCCAVCFE